MKESLNQKNRPWLDMVETISVVGSIGGSIASIFINQAALASIPLSITVMLNLVNRRAQLEAAAKNNSSAIAQIMPAVEANSQQFSQLQQQVKSNFLEHSQQLQNAILQAQTETHNKLEAISVQLNQSNTDLSQLKSDSLDYTKMLQANQLEVAELLQGKAEAQIIVDSVAAQLAEIQEIIPSLIEGNSNLMEYAKLQSLYEEQMEIVRKVGYLREIDTATQAIRIAPYDADAYHKRGIGYQALGDTQGSIGDFTEAIKLNPNHAGAFYSRGLAHIELGNKKRAVQDLREAAKLFFDVGDITSYQKAKDASKQIHELNSSVSVEENSEQVAVVGSLFA